MVSGARECFNHATQRYSATTTNQLAEGLKMKGSCSDRSRSTRFARGTDGSEVDDRAMQCAVSRLGDPT
jgi:hypothetical protein